MEDKTRPFNGLTPAEAERLAKLAEECGEIVQIIGKILVHGYEACHPADESKTTNRTLLRGELTDLQAVSWIMQGQGDISPDDMSVTAMAAGRKLAYCHHQ